MLVLISEHLLSRARQRAVLALRKTGRTPKTFKHPKFADRHTDMITDATLIVEVLSPSTENYDRGFKFEQYRRLGSLSDYLLISQDRVHIEHYTRQPDRSWLMRETSDCEAVIPLASIDCTLPVAEAYERVNFEAEG